jgi:hypothetical protein
MAPWPMRNWGQKLGRGVEPSWWTEAERAVRKQVQDRAGGIPKEGRCRRVCFMGWFEMIHLEIQKESRHLGGLTQKGLNSGERKGT